MKYFKTLLLIIASLVLLTACTPAEKGLTVREGKLRVGMDLQYPPFETFNTENQPIGISVDVAQALADDLDLELEVVNMDFSTLVPALETSAIDIVIASMSITEEREKKVDFSEPYFYFKLIGLMSRSYAEKNQITESTTAETLWSIADTRFVGLAGQISTTIPEQHGFAVKESVDKSAAITEIVNDRADLLIISPEVVVAANQAYPDETAVFWSSLDISPIGMAVAEGNSALLEKANDFIRRMDDQDGIYDQLRADYAETLLDLYGPGFSMDFYIYE